ncbi:MAG TPA: hypothetical protein VFM53_04680 [Anaeromyxobacteraceae bacterium]|nr:hypothetical protein [Anaeromyxobacteraceae bacterium]
MAPLPVLLCLLAAVDPPPAAASAQDPDPGAVADVLALEVDAGDGPLWARAGLAARYTLQAAIPSTLVLYDVASLSYAASAYLAPGPSQGYASGLAFVSAGWEPLSWLGFRLDVDTGLVRSQSFPATTTVCPSAASPSGLAPVGSATCDAPARYVLQTTAYGPSEITSNGQSFADEASQTAFIRQLYAEVVAGRAGAFHARLGRQRLRVADGFVYDDWGLGLDLDLDLGAIGPPFAFSASVFYPSRAWPTGTAWKYPVVAATAEWTPSLGEWVGVWGAWSRDASGDAASVLRQGLVQNQVLELLQTSPGSAAYRAASRRLAVLQNASTTGTSNLGWLGASGRLDLAGWGDVRFTLGAAFGTVGSAAGAAGGSASVPVLGWLATARLTAQPGGGWTLSPFLIWLTGDSLPSTQQILSGSGTWNGFLAISPYVTATNLFFQGGISESYADRRTSGSGVNARGVVAPGIQVGFTPGHGVDLVAKAAWLWADEASGFGGVSYGPEVDLNASWSPWRWLAVLAEADVLALGNFFPQGGVARRFIVGVNVSTP